MKVGDILLKAFFENDDILFIDIEIQTSFYQKIFKRWVENASRLFTNVGDKSLVLVLQIDEANKKSYSIYPCKKEENPFLEEKVDDTFEIVSINVKDAISLIEQNKPIKLGDINISEEFRGRKKLAQDYWTQILDYSF